MTTNFARHEQFLRIWKLLEVLEASRLPVADGDLVTQLKESLGLTSLSHRTLGRDCEFLSSCGYPVERRSLPEGRKQGWQLTRCAGEGKRWMPSEPLTLLELTAFLLGREQLRFAEGTVLWSGVESLWKKIADNLPEPLARQVAVMAAAWHVEGRPHPPYADRPRLLSLLCAAVTDCCEVTLTLDPALAAVLAQPADNGAATAPAATELDGHTTMPFQPHGLTVRSARMGLVGFPSARVPGRPIVIDLAQIVSAKPLDKVFEPCGESVRELVSRATWVDGTPVD